MGQQSAKIGEDVDSVTRGKAVAMMQVVVFDPEKVLDVNKIDELGKVQMLSSTQLSWVDIPPAFQQLERTASTCDDDHKDLNSNEGLSLSPSSPHKFEKASQYNRNTETDVKSCINFNELISSFVNIEEYMARQEEIRKHTESRNKWRLFSSNNNISLKK